MWDWSLAKKLKEKYINTLPLVLGVVVFVSVSVAFIIPTTMFLNENTHRRNDASKQSLENFQRLVDMELERLNITAYFLETDTEAKEHLENLWQHKKIESDDYDQLHIRLTDFLQKGQFSFLEIIDETNKVLINTGLKSRVGMDLAQWPPVQETSREKRFRGFVSLESDVYFVITSIIRMNFGDSAIVVLGQKLTKDLIKKWADYMKADFSLFDEKKILSTSFPPDKVTEIEPYIFRKDITHHQVFEDKKYAVLKAPLPQSEKSQLQIAAFSPTEDLKKQVHSVFMSMVLFVSPLLLCAFLLVYTIANRLQTQNLVYHRTNNLLQTTNHQLETLLKGLNAMALATSKEGAVKAFLKSMDRALGGWDLLGAYTQLTFLIEGKFGAEKLNYIYKKEGELWVPHQGPDAPPFVVDTPQTIATPSMDVGVDHITVALPAQGTGVASWFLLKVSEVPKNHREDLTVIQSQLSSLRVISANMVISERERSHLFELVRMAARISDALNSPLLVLQNSLEKIAGFWGKEHSGVEKKDWETLGAHVAHAQGAIESLMCQSKELSSLRDKGSHIEATESLFS